MGMKVPEDILAKIAQCEYNFDALTKKGEDLIVSRLMKVLTESKNETNIISAAKTLWAKIRPDKSEVKVEETRSPYEIFMESEDIEDREIYH